MRAPDLHDEVYSLLELAEPRIFDAVAHHDRDGTALLRRDRR